MISHRSWNSFGRVLRTGITRSSTSAVVHPASSKQVWRDPKRSGGTRGDGEGEGVEETTEQITTAVIHDKSNISLKVFIWRLLL